MLALWRTDRSTASHRRRRRRSWPAQNNWAAIPQRSLMLPSPWFEVTRCRCEHYATGKVCGSSRSGVTLFLSNNPAIAVLSEVQQDDSVLWTLKAVSGFTWDVKGARSQNRSRMFLIDAWCLIFLWTRRLLAGDSQGLAANHGRGPANGGSSLVQGSCANGSPAWRPLHFTGCNALLPSSFALPPIQPQAPCRDG